MSPGMSPRCHRHRSARVWSGVAPARQQGHATDAAARMVGVGPARSLTLVRTEAMRWVDATSQRESWAAAGSDGGISSGICTGRDAVGLAAVSTARTLLEDDLVLRAGHDRLLKGDAGVSTGAVRGATRAVRRRRLGRGSHTCILDPGRTSPPRTTRDGLAHDAVVWPNPTPCGAATLLARDASPVSRLAPGALFGSSTRTGRAGLGRPLVAVWRPRAPLAPHVVWPHVAWPRLAGR